MKTIAMILAGMVTASCGGGGGRGADSGDDGVDGQDTADVAETDAPDGTDVPADAAGEPPGLVVETPGRGTVTESMTGTVTGTVTGDLAEAAGLTVAGEEVAPGAGGGFSHPITYEAGTNLVETIATGRGGEASVDRRSVLAGSFAPPGTSVGQGMVARVNQGALDTFEGIAAAGVDAYDVSARYPYQVYFDEYEVCVFGTCSTVFALDVWIASLVRGVSVVEIDPAADGLIDVAVDVSLVEAPWYATGVVAEVPYSSSGTASVDTVGVTARLTPSVAGGSVDVAISDATPAAGLVECGFEAWMEDAEDYFGSDVCGLIEAHVEEVIEETVVSTVPVLLEEFLAGLEMDASLAIPGNACAITSAPATIAVDDTGVTIGYDTNAAADEWRLAVTDPGSLSADHGLPSQDPTPGLVVSYSASFLDQALVALWGGGLISGEVASGDVGFDPAALAIALDDPSDLRIVAFDALLPPVALPGAGGHLADLQVGDVEVLLCSGDPAVPSNVLLRIFVGMEAGIELDPAGAETLEASLVDVTSWIDVSEPSGTGVLEAGAEPLLAAIVPLISGRIAGAISEVPIPTAGGLALTSITVGSSGDDGGYIDVGGDI